MRIKKICCIGAGYVGGPTMAVIANNCPDIKVTVLDLNKEKIDRWNDKDFKKLPVYEPGLEEIINKIRGINLFFSTAIEKEIADADMIFISVNTPTKTKGIGAGKASNLKWIEASARQIAKYAKGETIIVEKSTLPVKTAETIKQILNASQIDNKNCKKFFVLSNPEFLAEGTAINDLQSPDRVLIGGENDEAIDALSKIYARWINPVKILKTNLWSAELSKLTANAFLAQRISSINSISALCEVTGANVKEVSEAIGMDNRIGSEFINAGPGFGGSCFKKDILNLVYLCNFYNLHQVAEYWEKVIEINSWQQKRISNLVVQKLFGTIDCKKIGILGFSFKANTNDTRESPSIQICKDLMNEGAHLSIYDPKVNQEQIVLDLEDYPNKDSTCELEKGSYDICFSIDDASKNSDALIILTEWEEFKYINWGNISSIMRKPSWVFDTRNILNMDESKSFDINFWSLGCDS